MNLLTVYEQLYQKFGAQNWWPAETPFEMMAGAILTQNTAWTNVEKALNNFKGRLSPEFILKTPEKELAEIIRPSGFFNQKSMRLKRLTEWFQTYDFDTERIRSFDSEIIRKELLSLSGVGKETADSILLYAFSFPYFVVDAYTRRIFSRIGFSLPADYDEIRNFIECKIPRNTALYNEYHALIVRLAKVSCKKVPECRDCPLFDCCESAQGFKT